MSKKLFLSTLALTLLSACGPLGGDQSLEERVAQQDMQLRQIRQQQTDAMNQIELMRQENKTLKGQLRALSGGVSPGYAINQEGAYQTPDGSAVPQTGASTTTAIPLPAEADTSGIKSTGAPESSAYASPPIPVPMTGQTSSPTYGIPDEQAHPDSQYQTVQAPSEETWGQADPKPEIQVPQKDLSLALFDAGVNSYNSRNYQAAERSFSDLLKNYPNHSQSAEAQYYLGECQFQTNHFADAALAYETVIKKYPKASVTPGAYLKQAICFSKMNQMAAARARMQEIISKFPNSPEASRAKSFLKSNK